MKLKILAIFACVLLGVTPGIGQEPEEGDIQFWNETKVYFGSYKKTDKNGKKQKIVSPFIMGTLRLGQDVKHFVNERAGFGFDVRLNKYFKFTPSYYYVAEQKVKNSKSFEHRLRFAITASKKWKNFGLSTRGRVEHRIKNSKSNTTRFRNKTKLTIPVRKDDKEVVTPFVANEPFYSFDKKEWVRNEFSAGVSKKWTKKFATEFFYLMQANKGNTLKRVNAVGVNLKITLD
ncbi:MAG: DUF2490 domain-containing protein [Pyrinomonadaceae bacterium]|nr:DUF2490 domain-containing protein [Pyrinomonadaceae bacterium]